MALPSCVPFAAMASGWLISRSARNTPWLTGQGAQRAGEGPRAPGDPKVWKDLRAPNTSKELSVKGDGWDPNLYRPHSTAPTFAMWCLQYPCWVSGVAGGGVVVVVGALNPSVTLLQWIPAPGSAGLPAWGRA